MHLGPLSKARFHPMKVITSKYPHRERPGVVHRLNLQHMRFDTFPVGSNIALEQVGMQAEDDFLPRIVVHQWWNGSEGARLLRNTLRVAFGQLYTRRTIKNT